MSKKLDLWKEGKYVDLWTIPHVIFGGISMFIFSYLGLNLLLNFLISVFIMVFWEFFELYFLGVKEHLPNKVMDVVTGIIGFGIMYYLARTYELSSLWIYFWIMLVVWLALNLFGLYASRKRNKK